MSTTLEKVPSVKEFFASEAEKLRSTNMLEPGWMLESAKKFAKMHVDAALKSASENGLIDRKPTGEGEISEPSQSKTHEGDLGYEEYIPVIYSINSESILNSYSEENIK